MATTRLDERSTIFPNTVTTAPYDAQIAYVLAGFIKNLRSLSVDPVVVRANWIDALDHVTPRGARALNAYARDESPFAKIGRQTITVEAIELARASSDAFDLRWQEQYFEAGEAIKRERFIGVLSIVFRSSDMADKISRNPLGVYVDRFTWRHEPIVGATR